MFGFGVKGKYPQIPRNLPGRKLLIVKKKVNTGVTFYFIDFQANFFRTNFFLAGTWQ